MNPDPVLAHLEARADDLREKLAGRRPFAVPTDSFRRAALEVGLRACEDAIEKREAVCMNPEHGGEAMSPPPRSEERVVVDDLTRDEAEHLFGRCTESTNAPKINGYSCETCRSIGTKIRAALDQSPSETEEA